jgi:MbtH protein
MELSVTYLADESDRRRYSFCDKTPQVASGEIMSTSITHEPLYKVVRNHEEQFSIWPCERDNAPGWFDVGKTGTKAECLAHIEQAWTDMRPASLRRQFGSA